MFSTHQEYLDYIASEKARNEHIDYIQCIRGATKIFCAKWENKTILLFGENHDLEGNEGGTGMCDNEFTFSIEPRLRFVDHKPKILFILTGDVGISISVHRLLLTLTGKLKTQIDIFLEHNIYVTPITRSIGNSALSKLGVIFRPCFEKNNYKSCFSNESTRIHGIDYRRSDVIYGFLFSTISTILKSRKGKELVEFKNDLYVQERLMESVKLHNLLFKIYGDNWEIIYFNDVLESNVYDTVLSPFLSFRLEPAKYFKIRHDKRVSFQRAQLLGLQTDENFELAQRLIDIAKTMVIGKTNIFENFWKVLENPAIDIQNEFLQSYSKMLNNFRLLMDIAGIARSLRRFQSSREPDVICGFFGANHTDNWMSIYSKLFGIKFQKLASPDACITFDINNLNDIFVKNCLMELLK